QRHGGARAPTFARSLDAARAPELTLDLTNQQNLIYTPSVNPPAPVPAPDLAGSAADLDRAVMLFHALSDATRLSILEMLRDGERCVCELQFDLDAAQSRLSFHLRVLREAGLVT